MHVSYKYVFYVSAGHKAFARKKRNNDVTEAETDGGNK